MTRLRVATYNIYLGADLSLVFGVESPEQLRQQAQLVYRQLLGTDFAARAEAIARLLVRDRVDVVGLQEVARWSMAAPGPDGAMGEPQLWCDFLAELLGALDRAGTRYEAHAANPNFHGSAAISERVEMSVLGLNVILVRRDSGIAVTSSRTGSYSVTLDIGTGMEGLVLNVPRSWGWVDAVVDGSRFRFVNTHTEAYDEPTRNAQRDELLHQVGDPGMPVIVVGDFNSPPESAGMPASFQDAWVVAGDGGPGHTCGQAPDLANAEDLLAERIDYVWVRDALVDSCRVVGSADQDRTTGANLWPSDHACVVCDIRLPA